MGAEGLFPLGNFGPSWLPAQLGSRSPNIWDEGFDYVSVFLPAAQPRGQKKAILRGGELLGSR